MVKYGVTWWGGQWLNALSDIDFSNRLPRGRSYANKGAVKEVAIRRNTIRAKVQGTRKTPYKVTLTVPEFSAGEKKALLEEIMGNPLLLSRLLNRELPRNLYEIANGHDIRIFPERWDDLGMHCSCPDWAVPCKHLAAVINVTANEIDRNPFLIFKLHTFDIIAELQKRGMAHIEERVAIPHLKSLAEAVGSAESGDPSGESDDPSVSLVQPGSFNLSAVPGMRENLLRLLNEKPVFYRADFKNILDKIYRKTARYASRELVTGYDEEGEDGIFYEKYDRVEIHLRQYMFYSQGRLGSGEET